MALAPLVLVTQAPQRTFLRLADLKTGDVDAAAAQLRSAIDQAGWKLLADYDAGVNRKKCTYRARVLIADWPEYTGALLHMSKYGAFAAQLRFVVFEDEAGVHVGAVNPRSLNRTIVAEEGRHEQFEAFAQQMEDAVHKRLPGTTSQYGQRRDRGRIGKTMGIMAGGPFPGKVETIATAAPGNATLAAFAADFYEKLGQQSKNGEWHMRPVFRQEISPDVVVIGMTSESMEAKSFDIVGAGGNNERSRLRCPGIDHAAAYPIEVALVRNGAHVDVQIIDEMFRMKMYFEDAGKMAFAKNMGMPGSLEDEVRSKVRAALAAMR